MAPYAYKYNDIFDDYVPTRTAGRTQYGNTAPRANAAPDRRSTQHRPPQRKEQPKLTRVEGTKKQGILAKNRTFKLFMIQTSIVLALFLSVGIMAIASKAELNSAKSRLETLESEYQLCLEQNNTLKFQLDEATKGINIDKIATEQLGLIKVPEKKTRQVRISDYS